MAFISYAQNFEDVMLARALSDVDVGVYIDVGAQDPEEGSVTKHFYDRGWHGLNFEPSEAYHARLVEARPRDLNLRCAVGAEPGSVTFYELESTGLSTIVESVTEEFTGAHVERTVPMTTLDRACAAYGITMAHFLKIDVEGAEELVLRGTRLDAIRPWIILVEATRPNSRVPHYAHWEPLLTDRGYRFVYADGLNRFYLAEEHAHLADRFALPPNYFDGFVLAGQARAEANLAHHLAVIDSLGKQVASQQEVLEHHVGLLTEVNERAESGHAEIMRLVGLLGEADEREKSGLAHHVGLLAEAAVKAEAQQAEIVCLAGLLGEANEREKSALTHHIQAIGKLEARIGELAALAARQRRQIASRDDKIAWITQDRDRFRRQYEGVTRSLSWIVTRPLRWGRRRHGVALPHGRASLVAGADDPQVLTGHQHDASQASEPMELPEPARWVMTSLQSASKAA